MLRTRFIRIRNKVKMRSSDKKCWESEGNSGLPLPFLGERLARRTTGLVRDPKFAKMEKLPFSVIAMTLRYCSMPHK